jgi:hypothetical protein
VAPDPIINRTLLDIASGLDHVGVWKPSFILSVENATRFIGQYRRELSRALQASLTANNARSRCTSGTVAMISWGGRRSGLTEMSGSQNPGLPHPELSADDRVRLITRGGRDWTRPWIVVLKTAEAGS